ncbi:MAG: beta-N-acetylhexosaminidase [Spirochaetia bacterium]
MKKVSYLCSVLTLGIFMLSCAGKNQRLVDSMSSQLEVWYEVVDNHAAANGVDAVSLGADWGSANTAIISLKNKGKEIQGKDWSIMFSSIRRILAVQNDQFEIKRITGDLHQLMPTSSFAGFGANQTVDIPIIVEYWQLFETDAIPGWYVVAEGASPKVIKNTDTEDVSKFMKPISGENWKRTKEDQNILMTPVSRFEKNASAAAVPASELRGLIIPTPLSLDVMDEDISLSAGISFVDSALDATSLTVIKEKATALGLKVNADSSGYNVRTAIMPESFDSGMQLSGAYTLQVTVDGTEIVGYDEVGVFYALQSLLSLASQNATSIPAVFVYDAPRFVHRGMHLDIARNFHTKASVLRLLDVMASYKLNKFHFHLSDDEGWRLEIPGLPELTTVGSKRAFDLEEKNALMTQLGSGPFSNNMGSGYLTRNDYIEILKYAKARHIEVIPEIDMPAHARAAVVSMEARYRNLSRAGRTQEAEEYRLMDPEDTSNVTTVQFYDKRSFINPALDSSKRFVEKVVSEISNMHKEAGMPLLTWHYGADETKNIHLGGGFQDINATDKVDWKGNRDHSKEDKPFAKSPAAQKLIEQGIIKDFDELSSYFAIEVSKILSKLGIQKMVAWQDGLSYLNGASDLAVPRAGINFWETLYWGGADSTPDWATKGFEVVLSNPDYLYFDFPYEVTPKESGYYWGTRFSDEQKVFAFAPVNLPQNAETSVDRDGMPFTSQTNKPWTGPYGIQAQLWSEVVRTDAQMEYMIYPRIISLAERAWHRADWELPYVPGREFSGGKTRFVNQAALNSEWQTFANLIGQRELPKFDQKGILYRLPVPGAKVENGSLSMNIALPGIQMQYSEDGKNWKVYEQPTSVGASVFVRSASSNGKRFSRVEKVE